MTLNNTEMSRWKRWTELCTYHLNNWAVSALHVIDLLQVPLQSVQRLCAVLPSRASPLAFGTVPPLGPLPQAGGPESGGGGRPGLQLEGWTHDASATLSSCLSFMYASPLAILYGLICLVQSKRSSSSLPTTALFLQRLFSLEEWNHVPWRKIFYHFLPRILRSKCWFSFCIGY